MGRKELIWLAFCRDARYIPNMLEPYTITVNGKILRSKETDKLFELYKKERSKTR